MSLKDLDYVEAIKLKLANVTRDAVKKLDQSCLARELANKWDSVSALEVKPGKHLLMHENTKLIPPKDMRKQVIERVHFSRTGYQRTLQTLQKSYYWNNMSEQVKKIVELCSICFQLQNC